MAPQKPNLFSSFTMAKTKILATVFVTLFIGSTVAKAQGNLPSLDYPRIKYDGPNCFNFALLKSKAMNHYRGVNLHEFWFYLQSPFCQQVPNNQQPQEGDIVSVIHKDKGLHHAFIYFNEDVGFGVPFQIGQVEHEYLSKYRMDSSEKLIYHRCNFLSLQHASSYTLQKHPQLKDIIEKTDAYEVEIGKLMLGQIAMDKEQLKKTVTHLVGLHILLPKNSTDLFTRLLQFKIEGLMIQAIRSRADVTSLPEDLIRKLQVIFDNIKKRDEVAILDSKQRAFGNNSK